MFVFPSWCDTAITTYFAKEADVPTLATQSTTRRVVGILIAFFVAEESKNENQIRTCGSSLRRSAKR